MSHYQIHLEGKKPYPMNSSLELESVRDALRISPKLYLGEICLKTNLTKEKVIDALKELARQKLLARWKGKYYLVER